MVYSTDIEELKRDMTDIKSSVNHDQPGNLLNQGTQSIFTDVLFKRINQEHEANLKHEAYSRRNNVVIEGVREHTNEDCVDIVADICNSVLNLPDMHRYIDKAHRYGYKKTTGPRSIIVRFIYHQDAELVLTRSGNARAAGLRLSPDYPKEIKREHILLDKIHRLALRDGRSTKLKGNRLYYNGKTYSIYDVHTAGLDIGRIAERKEGKKMKFYGRFSKFSNFYPVELSYKDKRFSSAEQLYQYRRAENVNDRSLAIEILLANDPADCKALAKHIPEDRERDLGIMRDIVEQKFSQAPFKLELQKTGTSELMECNPYDRYWGTGRHMDERDSTTVIGENHLGKLLQEYRGRIVEVDSKH